MIGISRPSSYRCTHDVYDHNEGPNNRYTGKWNSDRYGVDVYDQDTPCSFEHNVDSYVTVLYDMRYGHGGYLGILWVTDEFAEEGLSLYVAEAEDATAKAFEYYQDAVKWLQSIH